jgi:hypothetical protein
LLSLCALALPARALSVTSETHPAHVFYDFATDAVPFASYAVPGGVPSGARFAVQDGVLQLTNAFAGSFGVDTKIAPFDADKFGHVFFDYKLSPQVKVNIFFRVKGKYHAAIFSGAGDVRPGSVWLGQIADVQADGKWHRAHIPLRAWLRRLYPLDDDLKVDEVIIGNWDNDGFLMAGIGGNGTGASWSLDDFAILSAGPHEAKLQLQGEPSELADATWSLDGQNPAPLPGAALAVSADDGFHVVQIKDKNGHETAAYPLLMAAAPPRIGAARLEGNSIVVPIEAAAGLQTKELKLRAGGRDFDLSSPFLTWDGAAGVLRLDAGQAGFTWKDGERVPLALSGVLDVQGHAASKDDAVEVSFRAHQAAPPLPRLLIGETEAPRDTFENGVDGWEKKDEGGAIIERDATVAASGHASLRLTCPANAALFGAWIRRNGFDAAQHPLVSFRYKIPPSLRADFVVGFNGQEYAVGFTDGPQPNKKIKPPPRIGAVDGVQADGQWHRGEFNLLEMLQKLQPNAPSYKITSLAISDGGWPGNYGGVQYWIDDFQLAPAVGAETTAHVALGDITGVQAVSWVLDENPDTIPPRTANGESTLALKGQGRRWLHLRAQNGAGQWSEPAHFLLLFK